MSESITLYLGNPDIILMRRPESPALVHGQIPPDAHAMLVALWDAEDRPKGTASVERGEEGLVAVATITSPIEIDLRVVLDLPPDKAAGLERRPSAMVMIYPDEESRMAGLNDFRSGGARGDWLRLGIVLPQATTDPLREPLP